MQVNKLDLTIMSYVMSQQYKDAKLISLSYSNVVINYQNYMHMQTSQIDRKL